MSLQAYDRDHTTDGLPDWPLYHLDDEGRPVKHAPDLPFRPGDTVCHVRKGGTGYGTVVAISDDQVVVLWSEEPAPDPFGSFVLPVIKRASPQLVAQSLVSIQPMSVPSGLLFYMDYQYGSGSQAPSTGSSQAQGCPAGPTVGPPINPCPPSGVAIGPRAQYLGPGYRGTKRGGHR